MRDRAGELPDPQRDALDAAFGLTHAAVPELFLIAMAVLNLLGETRRAMPVLLVVEDAHWLDRSSARCARVRRAAAGVGAGGPAGRGPRRLSSSFDEAGLRELRLERLDDEAAAALLDARDPGLAPAVRRRVLNEAAGNPLALVELPLASQGQRDDGHPAAWLPLTTRLERAFAARVSGLPAATRTLLLVAALNDGDSLTETLDATRRSSGQRSRWRT